MGYIGNQPFLGAVTGDTVVDGTVGTVDLTDGAVTAAKLATTAILDKLGYTPVSTAGTGATGTWGISISGNAATATTATNISGGTASVTTLEATTVDATNVEVTNVKAKDGTAAIAIADSTGAVTVSTPTVVSVNSSSTALRITQVGSGNALLVEDSANPDSTPFAVDSTGFVLAGYTANVDSSQIQTFNGSQTNFRWNAASTGPNSNFKKSRSTVVNSYSIVGNGDRLGTLRWFGDDGAAFVEAASVQAEVDGTPGTNDMPGRLVFSTTADGAATPTERMRITSAGNVGIGTASPGVRADISGVMRSSTWSLSGTGVTGGTTAFSAGTVSTDTNWGMYFRAGTSSSAIAEYSFRNSADTERMRIDSSGNVGIGKTPAAGRLLDVNADSWFNGVRVGRGSLSNNTIVGSNALISTTTGDYNVAVGFEAGNANTTGYQNTFVGYRAGLTNTTAIFNTAIGCNALQAATTGAGNTAVGNQCLQLTTTGGNNSAVGVYALYANTTGSLNTAIGYAASMGQTTALYNVAVGAYSLHYTTTGSANTSTGYYSLLNCTTGGNNTSIGYYSGTGITTGSHNVLIGQQAGYHSVGIITGVANICVGNYADVQASSDNYSIVIGYLAQGKGTSTGFIAPYNGGSMYQGNNSSSWATTSDRRIKKNIVDCTLGLEKINQIRVCNFEYRTKDEIDPSIPQSSAVPKAGVQLGVIAQEIQQIIPESVKEESTGVLSVDTDRVIWHLVNAVKELSAQVDALKARIGE